MGCISSSIVSSGGKHRREERAKKKERARQNRRDLLDRLSQQVSDKDLLSNPRVKAQVELIAEFTNLALMIWSSQGIILYTNQTLLDMVGHTDDSIKPGNRVEKLLVIPAPLKEDGYLGMLHQEITNVPSLSRDNTAAFLLNMYTTDLSSDKEDGDAEKDSDNDNNNDNGRRDSEREASDEIPSPRPEVQHVYCSVLVLSPNDDCMSAAGERSVPRNPLLERGYSWDAHQKNKRNSHPGESGSAGSAASASGVGSPRASSPRPGSPAFERKMQNAGDVILVSDVGGRLLRVSEGAAAILDREVLTKLEDEAAVVFCDQLLHPNEAKTLSLLIDADRVEQMTSLEKRYAFKAEEMGTEMNLMCASRTELPHNHIAFRFAVPPKKRAVQFMRKTFSDEVAGVLDVCPHATMCIGKNARIEYWNPAAAKLFGVSQEAIHRQPVTAIIPYPYNQTHPTTLMLNRLPHTILTTKRAVVARSFSDDEQKVFPVFVSIRHWPQSSEKQMFVVVVEPIADAMVGEVLRGKLQAAERNHPEHPLQLQQVVEEDDVMSWKDGKSERTTSPRGSPAVAHTLFTPAA
eukprot:Rhum_TRINITY_DN6808_c0_g2::Rhum_TRINITY_DN6808_c0_g2_i1::g.21014::m.21014